MAGYLRRNSGRIRIFFVAKRKRKRKSPAAPPAKRNNRPFVGDHILAMYQMIVCCFITTLLAGLASLATGLEFTTKYKTDLAKNISNKDIVTQINSLSATHGYILFGVVVVATIFSIAFVLSTWRGRKWALITHLALHLPSAAITIIVGTADGRYGSIPSLVIAFYCLLRLLGSIGPKP